MNRLEFRTRSTRIQQRIAAFLIGLAAVVPALSEEMDQREVLALSAAQRNHVLEEMRALLAGSADILAALAREDMTAVAASARSLGMGMARNAEGHLKGVLPGEFMQLGMAVHQNFDLIAADAGTIRDPKHTLRQLGETMGKCVACHAKYQIRPAAPLSTDAGTAGHHLH